MERKSQGHKLKSVVELCSEPLCIYFNHTEEMCFGDIFVLAACPALAPTKLVVTSLFQRARILSVVLL